MSGNTSLSSDSKIQEATGASDETRHHRRLATKRQIQQKAGTRYSAQRHYTLQLNINNPATTGQILAN